ncbi:MAG: hypothetical protein KW804_03405, partial [Candidatus Doudnabacteria bacterium]|nr:hypothetical protein [Candidatus Doudnabacteria bacterium]
DEGITPTFVIGVNHDKYKNEKIISNASCTTNCISPVIAVLHGKFGIKKMIMSTIHSYTAEQNLVDGPPPGGKSNDLRRARAAAVNIIPTSTGATIATTEAIPELKGKLAGAAYRVPTPVGSLADFILILNKNVTVEEVNKAFIEAAKLPLYSNVLEVTNDPIVSSDIIGNPHSAIVDLALTQVVDGDMVKVVAWYDNEFGYWVFKSIRRASNYDRERIMPAEQDPKDIIFKVPPKAIIEHPEKSFLVRHILAEVLGVVFVIALGAAGYYWQTTRIETPVFEPVKHEDASKNWRIYTNTSAGFEFKYPDDWVIEEKIAKWDAFGDVPTVDVTNKNLKFNVEESLTYAFWSVNYIKDIYDSDIDKYLVMTKSDDLREFMKESHEIDNRSTYSFTTNYQDYKIVFANGYVFMLQGAENAGFQNATQDVRKIYESILSSFKFTTNPTGSCIQVIQTAKNPKTGEVRDFPTPCDVPEGWVKVSRSQT